MALMKIDRMIDVRELQRGLQHLGCVDASLEAATRIIESFDSDESNTIEREEFVQWSLAKFLAKPPTQSTRVARRGDE